MLTIFLYPLPNGTTQFDLGDRSMTWLHQTGLAGLWMTLSQLGEQFPNASQRPRQLDWQLSSTGINLYWSGHDLDVLDWLFKQSFQINQQGMVSFKGLKPSSLNIYTQLAIHQGITHTFLQHPQSYKSNGRNRLIVEIDRSRISMQYKQLTSYIHQGFAEGLCDQGGQILETPIRISSWLYPGAVMSHALFHEQTKFEVSPEEALVLLFAPVACWYFTIPADPHCKQTNYALVIPEVADLAAYAEFCWKLRNLSYAEFWAASLRDAGLKFLTAQENSSPIGSSEMRRCQSVFYGKAKWSSQQMTRVDTAMVEATKETIYNYQLMCRYSLDNRIRRYEEKPYIAVSRVREIAADNLAQSLPWWYGFAKEIDSKEFCEELNSTWEGLLRMIEEGEWNDQGKRLFVRACHETLRRSYAKLYDRTPEGDYSQIERFNVRFQSDLGRCKNATVFREFISKFFSKAGQVPTLQEHWEELLPITTGEVDWKLARDLTLLALASYPKNEIPKDDRKSKAKELKNLKVIEDELIDSNQNE